MLRRSRSEKEGEKKTSIEWQLLPPNFRKGDPIRESQSYGVENVLFL